MSVECLSIYLLCLPLFLSSMSYGLHPIIFYFILLDLIFYFLFFKDFLHLFLEEKGREGERERNINVWLPFASPHWGPGPHLRHMPWLGIEPVTLWFTGLHSIYRMFEHLQKEPSLLYYVMIMISTHVPRVLTTGNRVVKTHDSRLKPLRFILTQPFLSYMTLNRLLVSAVTQYNYQ